MKNAKRLCGPAVGRSSGHARLEVNRQADQAIRGGWLIKHAKEEREEILSFLKTSFLVTVA